MITSLPLESVTVVMERSMLRKVEYSILCSPLNVYRKHTFWGIIKPKNIIWISENKINVYAKLLNKQIFLFNETRNKKILYIFICKGPLIFSLQNMSTVKGNSMSELDNQT